MHPIFDLAGQTPFDFSADLPGNYKGPVLQGAAILTAQSPAAGTIIIQELVKEDFIIRFSMFNLLRPFIFAGNQKEAMLVSFLSLKNSIGYTFRGLGNIVLRQNQFFLLHSRGQDGSTAFAKAGNYQSFEVAWPEKIVERYISRFSFLKPLSSLKDSRRSFFVTPFNKPTGYHAIGLAQSILQSHPEKQGDQFLFEHKVVEYMLALLITNQNTVVPGINMNKTDYEKIIGLGELLKANPGKKFPMEDLTGMLNMNEKKLSKLFQKIFGTTIFDYHLQARLREAHRLLEQTDFNTKQIKDMVGYDYSANFITSFRKFFGYPPSELRKL